jgi:hypothetical protein
MLIVALDRNVDDAAMVAPLLLALYGYSNG